MRKAARKPWITREMIEKMEKWRRYENIFNDVGRTTYRRLSNDLRRKINKAKKKYLRIKCEEIMKFQRIGRYDFIYKGAKELGWGEILDIRNSGIKDSQGKIVSDQRRGIEVWEVCTVFA